MTHYKDSDGNEVVRTSHILGIADFGSEALKQWASNTCFEKAYRIAADEGKLVRTKHKKECSQEYKRIAAESCAIGTMVHWLIECYYANIMKIERPVHPKEEVQEFENTDEFKAGVDIGWQSFELFRADHPHLKILQTEQRLVSDTYKYGGTVDAIGENNDPDLFHKPVILLDWKTSNSINNKYYLQAAAYDNLLQENLGLKADCAWIVRIDKKKPKYDKIVIERPMLDQCFDLYKDLVVVRKKAKELGFVK